MTPQSAFRAAMLNPDAAVPPGLTDPRGRPAARRFAIYRNNVAVSLTEALEVTFPVLRELVGCEFFTAMAGIFLRAHPPTSPILATYGAKMGAFLETFEPVAHLPYLPDVARLEHALCAAYHEADATPVTQQRLAAIDPVAFLSARLTLAPALRLIRSDWPVAGIWRTHAESGPPPGQGPEEVLITRPAFAPRVHVLPPGAGAFVAALARGATLSDAAEGAPSGFDLGTTLSLLLAEGAITDIHPGDHR